jgi:predicted metal-dependent hydrolase
MHTLALEVSMAQGSDRPGATRELTSRPMQVALDTRTPRHWMGGDAWETQLMNALSLTFPAGERFFMRSVRALREHVRDPLLAAQVKTFLAQEAMHGREHSVLNRWLKSFGYPAGSIERRLEARIHEKAVARSALDNLAVTCALEHFTAILAKLLLTDASLRARFHESMLPLWMWHAIEELDHKAVAFDVYAAASGSYERRVLWMVAASVGLISATLIIQWHLLKRDGAHTDLRGYLRGLARYAGPRGLLRPIVPAYLRYYRRDFHPWQEDDRALIAAAERELTRMAEAWAEAAPIDAHAGQGA